MQKESIPDARRSEDIPFGSNGIRLSAWEWVVVAVLCSALFYFGPALWGQLGELESGPDYRLGYKLSGDYWLYDRLCRQACSRHETVVLGDSVVWGHYVPGAGTLSHYLNENAGHDQFVNLGVDGFHPAALGGLLRYYGRDISGKKVILHLNPLWMTSRKHDLQIEKEFRFNHPKLVPQFTTRIPCYKDSFSKRFSAVLERNTPLLGWTSHLKMAYFENMDLPTWTMEHPYRNPLAAITLELPVSENDDPQEYVSWEDRGISKQDFQWVEPGTSLQWSFFRQTIKLLRARKNTVFVLVGPFNEHIFKGQSADVYRKMQNEIADWLRQNNVAFFMPPALPSELYSDASHPLAEGYAMLAEQLFENESFRSSILQAH
ncbi:MAG: hypothetical protein CEE38_16445 [Planctomycetes bacterium B3_Pla]|nr:MAG: hypothetical protein CEE38_16445 [Planctomycetes bacterium B3_Pla]